MGEKEIRLYVLFGENSHFIILSFCRSLQLCDLTGIERVEIRNLNEILVFMTRTDANLKNQVGQSGKNKYIYIYTYINLIVFYKPKQKVAILPRIS